MNRTDATSDGKCCRKSPCERSGMGPCDKPASTNTEPTDALNLGDDHYIEFVAYSDDPRTGGNVRHKTSAGEPCVGWVTFAGGAWAQGFAPGSIATWDVQSKDPLTLTPSILCRACGDHGFITNGKWVRA